MDDFKRPVDDETPNNDPTTAAPAQFEDKETYVTPEGLNTSTPLAITKKQSGAKKWFLGGVVVLLLAGLGAFAYWQYAEAENVRAENESLAKTLKTTQVAQKEDTETDTSTPARDTAPEFESFMNEYADFTDSKVSVAATNDDKVGIEKGIKDYYKMSTLPSAWAILSVYKDTDGSDTNLSALVYWPAGDKPAGFFVMHKDADSTWKYGERE